MKSIMLAIVPVIILLAIVLVGCGQKGPLFLPGHNPNPPKPLLKNSHAAPPADHTGAENNAASSEN